MRWLSSNRYLSRLNAPPSQAERQQLERVLSYARLALALLTFLAAYLDATEPTKYARIVSTLIFLWTLYSFGVIAWVRAERDSKYQSTVLLIADILWPTLLTVFTHGPSSPLFPLFFFAVTEAAFRWGFPETMFVCGGSVALISAQALLLTGSTKPYHELQMHEFEINSLIIRLSYLVVLGFLMGKLGENEKIRRAESVALNRVLRAARVEHGMTASLRAVFGEFLTIFQAEQAYFVVQDLTTGRVFLWHGPSRNTISAQPHTTERGDHARHLLQEWPTTFFCEKNRGGRITMKSLANDGPRVASTLVFPDASFHAGEVRSLLCTSSDLGGEWRFRLLVVNAQLGPESDKELRFAEQLASQSATAVYSVYLVRRLRSRAGAMERARVAREIHDGAIQSLISAEMRVDVLRRRSERLAPDLAPELTSIQGLLREEVLSLRELMQQMRPVDLGPQQLVDFLADTIERFRRDSGIAARFVSQVDEEVSLTPHVCRELVKITQEALVNVRKHAEASNVLVTFAHTPEGGWKLTVADDGKGFNFSGTVQYTDLLASAKGPAIIKERVHAIGGELTVVSDPGSGAKLEITLHQKGSISYGR